MKKALPLLLAAAAILSCTPKSATGISRTDFVLGTVCSIRLLEGGSEKAADEAFARLRQIEDRMSANKEGTEIDAVNKAAGGSPVKVSEDTFFVISKALEYARLTGGAFDPTVGPLVKLWNIGAEGARVPLAGEISEALRLIDFRKVEMDQAAGTVRLAMKGMRLDMGAIAKGYSADEVAKIMARHGVKAAIIDLGGNVLVFGDKKDGSPWRVGIQDPASERGEYLGLVTGRQMTVVTSGVYERFFIQDGKRYHHILDTKSGYPVSNGLVSVSIVAESSVNADALSTSVFALGMEKGMELVKSLPGVYAIFVDGKNAVYLSPGADKIFTLTAKGYTLGE